MDIGSAATGSATTNSSPRVPVTGPNGKVRFAVVGLGYIAQTAVLPAFKRSRVSELTALVSGDKHKLTTLSKKYKVPHTASYEDYEQLLKSGNVDAVYIATPNNKHNEFAIPALRKGIHVLCEKPLATTASACREMIRAAEEGGAKLMTGYRLHFEPANVQAIKYISSGTIGDPRLFLSSFSYQIKSNNARLERELGGGALFDIGIYCINAARFLFRAEPVEVYAAHVNNGDPRFHEVDGTSVAILKFPDDRVAQFNCSFAAGGTSWYEVVGTKGSLRMDPAYEYQEPLSFVLTKGDNKKRRSFKRTDQFAAELIYFSECIKKGLEPEPSGKEGLADIIVLEALYRSAKLGHPVKIETSPQVDHPNSSQAIKTNSPPREPSLVHSSGPTAE